MSTGSMNAVADVVGDAMERAREAMHVGRAFGAAYEVGDATFIPVATVMGGAGGGGGDDRDDAAGGDGGFGSGFGMRARPVGVFRIVDDGVEWKPVVDVNRIARGGQVLAAILAICVTLVVLRRSS